MRSSKKRVEGGWTHTEKPALLQLVETEKKIFYKKIMSNIQTKGKYHMGEFCHGGIFGCSFRYVRVPG